MNNIKKIIFGAILGFFSLGAMLPVLCLAQTGSTINEIEQNLGAAAETGAGYAKPTDPRVTAAFIIRAALSVIGIVFLVLIIYAGFLWMTAGGNDESVTKAKNTLKAATIGLAIILAAYSITFFVFFITAGGAPSAVPNAGIGGVEYQPLGQSSTDNSMPGMSWKDFFTGKWQ